VESVKFTRYLTLNYEMAHYEMKDISKIAYQGVTEKVFWVIN